ncbi:MAG: hypothetical protein ACERLM_14655 [Acidimicrobiales bacterium]
MDSDRYLSFMSWSVMLASAAFEQPPGSVAACYATIPPPTRNTGAPRVVGAPTHFEEARP